VGAPPPTRLQVKGKEQYFYRAVDSVGQTIDFLLSPKRDRIAAKAFLQLALLQAGQIRPRVINVGRAPRVSAGHRRSEKGRTVEPELPMSPIAVHEQHHRAG
jgi:transposase, IS6 family